MRDAGSGGRYSGRNSVMLLMVCVLLLRDLCGMRGLLCRLRGGLLLLGRPCGLMLLLLCMLLLCVFAGLGSGGVLVGQASHRRHRGAVGR